MSDVIQINPSLGANGAQPEAPEKAPYIDVVVETVNSADDISYLTMGPKKLSGSIFAGRTAEEAYPVIPFKLVQTSIREQQQLMADVRIINLTDRTILDMQPHKVRELIDRLFFNTNTSPVKVTGKQRTNQNLDRLKEICYAYGCAGFVSPKLVLSQTEEDLENDILWVGRIALADLHEFWRICEGADDLAARRLEGFSE